MVILRAAKAAIFVFPDHGIRLESSGCEEDVVDSTRQLCSPICNLDKAALVLLVVRAHQVVADNEDGSTAIPGGILY